MKKSLLSIAILLVSSIAAFANPTNSKSNDAAMRTERSCTVKDKKNDGKKPGRKYQREICMFKGLDLTAEQKAKLSALREKNRPEFKNKKDRMRKSDKQKLTAEQKQQLKSQRLAERKANRQAYLAGIKEILTPAQYVRFLENNFTSAGHYGAKGKNNGKGFRGGKGDKKVRGEKHASMRNGRKSAS